MPLKYIFFKFIRSNKKIHAQKSCSWLVLANPVQLIRIKRSSWWFPVSQGKMGNTSFSFHPGHQVRSFVQWSLGGWSWLDKGHGHSFKRLQFHKENVSSRNLVITQSIPILEQRRLILVQPLHLSGKSMFSLHFRLETLDGAPFRSLRFDQWRLSFQILNLWVGRNFFQQLLL